MSHPSRQSWRALALASLSLLLAAPAPAVASVPTTTAAWGYSGLALMPTAHVHGFRDYSVGASVLTMRLMPSLVPYATAGVFEALEFGVLYGIPVAGFSGLSGHAKYQLVRPTRDRPTAVAVGLSMIGVGASDRYLDGNNLYLVLSQDVNTTLSGVNYTLFSAHFGFAGNLTLGSRMMVGVEVPIGERGSLVADYMGPMGTAGGFFNLGAAYRLSPEWQGRLYSFGAPGMPWTDRDYGLGVSYSGNLLGNAPTVGERPGPSPTVSPSPGRIVALPSPMLSATPVPLPSLPGVPLSSPAPSLAPSAAPSPEPTPEAAFAPVRGPLLDDKGRPLPGWRVGVAELSQWATTDARGRYQLTLPLGPYQLTVQDPDGKTHLSKPIRLVTAKGMELPLVVNLPVGSLKGMVIDKGSKQGLGDAKVQLFREGETYNMASRDNGALYMPDVPAGEYRVVVTRPRYRPFQGTLRVNPRQEASLIVAMTANPGSLAGRVTDLKGQGQPGVTVRLPKLGKAIVTDRLGAYQFADVPPGEHEVVFLSGQRQLSTTLVRIRPDETTTENVTMLVEQVAKNQGGTISGQVLDAANRRPIPGVKIVVEGPKLTVLTITASDGRYTVSDLPAGRYKITATRAGYKARSATGTVSATHGATVDIGLNAGR